VNLKAIRAKFKELRDKGFVPSVRRGPTGIGHTLEHELGLHESNIALPDFGSIELKSFRLGSRRQRGFRGAPTSVGDLIRHSRAEPAPGLNRGMNSPVFARSGATQQSHNTSDTCNECGHSVAWGSGRFVNRVPDLNDVALRREMGKPFPKGDYLCEECDLNVFQSMRNTSSSPFQRNARPQRKRGLESSSGLSFPCRRESRPAQFVASKEIFDSTQNPGRNPPTS